MNAEVSNIPWTRLVPQATPKGPYSPPVDSTKQFLQGQSGPTSKFHLQAGVVVKVSKTPAVILISRSWETDDKKPMDTYYSVGSEPKSRVNRGVGGVSAHRIVPQDRLTRLEELLRARMITLYHASVVGYRDVIDGFPKLLLSRNAKAASQLSAENAVERATKRMMDADGKLCAKNLRLTKKPLLALAEVSVSSAENIPPVFTTKQIVPVRRQEKKRRVTIARPAKEEQPGQGMLFG